MAIFLCLLTFHIYHLCIFYTRGVSMNTISIDEVMKMDNPIIVDIRDNYSYNISHIKNSINIPYYNLLSNFSHYLDKNKIYYLYCDEGRQSYEISKRLNSFGYRTLSISGGFISFR